MDAHKNHARSTVAVAPSPAASGTTLSVAAGHGARFPAVPFNATVKPANTAATPANAEIIRVTNIAGDDLTIDRTEETSSARTILVGDEIIAGLTVKTITDIETAIAGLTAAVASGELPLLTADPASPVNDTFWFKRTGAGPYEISVNVRIAGATSSIPIATIP